MQLISLTTTTRLGHVRPVSALNELWCRLQIHHGRPLMSVAKMLHSLFFCYHHMKMILNTVQGGQNASKHEFTRKLKVGSMMDMIRICEELVSVAIGEMRLRWRCSYISKVIAILVFDEHINI